MELKPGIAGQLAEATQGYPFLIQLIGYHAWQLARRAQTNLVRQGVVRHHPYMHDYLNDHKAELETEL